MRKGILNGIILMAISLLSTLILWLWIATPPTAVMVPIPPVIKYDVTVFAPMMGPRTIVVDSEGFTMDSGCFISTRPKLKVLCNVLEVTPCLEDCSPPPAGVVPAPASTTIRDESRVAENGR